MTSLSTCVVAVAMVLLMTVTADESTIMTATIDATDASSTPSSATAGVDTLVGSLTAVRAAIGDNCTTHDDCVSAFCFNQLCREDIADGTPSLPTIIVSSSCYDDNS